MSGNVWEWTLSLWGREVERPDHAYPYVPGDEREDETSSGDVLRVARGGSWYHDSGAARCACRYGYAPANRDLENGFRVVVAPLTSIR